MAIEKLYFYLTKQVNFSLRNEPPKSTFLLNAFLKLVYLEKKREQAVDEKKMERGIRWIPVGSGG